MTVEVSLQRRKLLLKSAGQQFAHSDIPVDELLVGLAYNRLATDAENIAISRVRWQSVTFTSRELSMFLAK